MRQNALGKFVFATRQLELDNNYRFSFLQSFGQSSILFSFLPLIIPFKLLNAVKWQILNDAQQQQKAQNDLKLYVLYRVYTFTLLSGVIVVVICNFLHSRLILFISETWVVLKKTGSAF